MKTQFSVSERHRPLLACMGSSDIDNFQNLILHIYEARIIRATYAASFGKNFAS